MWRYPIVTASGALLSAASAALPSADLQLGQAARILGLTPHAMAASGLTAAEVTAWFEELRGSAELLGLLGAYRQLGAAETGFETACRANDPLEVEGAAAIARARGVVDTARGDLEAAGAALLSRAGMTLGAGQRSRLGRWRASGAALPAEFRVAVWSASEEKSLLGALLEERLAEGANGSLSPGAAATLAAARSRPEVAQAIVALQTGLAEVSAAFGEAVR